MTKNETKPTDVKRPTIADRIEEAGELFRDERYHLPPTRRRTRPNPFARILKDMHDRPEPSE